MAKQTVAIGSLDEFRSYIHHDGYNNSRNYRNMKISKGGVLIANLNIILQTGSPLIAVPKMFQNIKIKDITFKGPGNNPAFEDYVYEEFLQTTGDILEVSPTVYNRLLSERSTLDGIEYDTRYKVLATVVNPNNGLSYTFFLDTLHADIFYLTGLDIMLDEDITLISSERNNIINVKGYSVITDTFSRFKYRAFKITDNLSNPTSSVYSSIKQLNYNMKLPNLKAYLVPCNKDLFIANGANIVPTIYDKELSPNREIQIAKYPMIVIELGLSKDLLTADPEFNILPHFVISSDGNNRLSYSYNGKNYKATTRFGVVIPGI